MIESITIQMRQSDLAPDGGVDPVIAEGRAGQPSPSYITFQAKHHGG
jgi:hypothetical protein